MSEITERLRVAIADRYTIERELGAGGMATVYLAQDLKHDRKVALKVLRPELAAVLGADRFVQEIKTTAALQHPHILPLFDSGTAGGLTDEASTAQPLNRSTAQFLYYVMPYIEGETLRDKLTRETQLSIDEAVRITTEVADALDYAHRHGVIHRDIKPENILLHDGRPMVADFGIALAVSAAAGGRMTETGMSLGTPHYMSPEQATADKDITARSDVYSLASMLYEMLTGEPPHLGGSAQQIIMKIISETAKPVTELRKSVPPNVAAAVGRALEKLPADRFDSAKAFADALANPSFTSATIASSGPTVLRSFRPSVLIAGLAATAVLAIALAAWGWLRPTPGSTDAPVVEFYLDPPGPSMSITRLAVSPDGQRIVAEITTDTGTVLYQRTLDARDWRIVPGTDGATTPFLSPDGAWLGFMTPADKSIKRIPVAGGAAQTIARGSGTFFGGTWGPDNAVVFSMNGDSADGRAALFRVSAEGGAIERLTRADSSAMGHGAPHYFDGDVVLFVVVSPAAGGSQTSLASLSLETGEITHLGPGGSPQSDGSGRVTYVTQEGVVMAQPFDRSSLSFGGSPRRIGEGVQLLQFQIGVYALSRTGVLVYQMVSQGGEELVLVGRDGQTQALLSGAHTSHPRFSPSGDRIAYIQTDETDLGDLWVYSLADGTAQRLSSGGPAGDPAWTHDGHWIGYSIRADGEARSTLHRVRADGTGSDERILAGDNELWQMDFGPGDREIVFRSGDNNVYRTTIGSDEAPVAVLDGAAFEQHAVLSSDGQWLAYMSNETGQNEVYVQSYPDMGPRTVVSVGGGSAPAWSDAGDELFYRGRTGMIVASLRHERDRVAVSERTQLFRTELFRTAANRNYDVHPGGQEFVMVGRGRGTRAVVRVGAVGEGKE